MKMTNSLIVTGLCLFVVIVATASAQAFPIGRANIGAFSRSVLAGTEGLRIAPVDWQEDFFDIQPMKKRDQRMYGGGAGASAKKSQARARRIMRDAHRRAQKQRADRARWLRARARNRALQERQYKAYRQRQILKRRQLRARSRCRVRYIGNLVCTVCQPGNRMMCRALRKSAKVRKLYRRAQRAKNLKRRYRRAKKVCRTVRRCFPASYTTGAFCRNELVCK